MRASARAVLSALLLAACACGSPQRSRRSSTDTSRGGMTSAPTAVSNVPLPAAAATPETPDLRCDSTAPAVWPGGPVIRLDRDGPRLVLTADMERILQDSLPGFTPWTSEHYHPDVLLNYVCTHGQLPWAVVADFNSDGRGDVAVDGVATEGAGTVALVSDPVGYRLIRVRFAALGSGVIVPHREIRFLPGPADDQRAGLRARRHGAA